MTKPIVKPVLLRISEGVNNALTEYAEQNRLSRSKVADEAIAAYLQLQEDANA